MAQIFARTPIWMTLRTMSLTIKSDLRKPLRVFRSARTSKTVKVKQCVYNTRGRQMRLTRYEALRYDLRCVPDNRRMKYKRLGTSNNVNCNLSVQGRKYALRGPRTGHYVDHTEYKGKERKKHGNERLDATLCQSINTERWM
jgi:hypothetical protein